MKIVIHYVYVIKTRNEIDLYNEERDRKICDSHVFRESISPSFFNELSYPLIAGVRTTYNNEF